MTLAAYQQKIRIPLFQTAAIVCIGMSTRPFLSLAPVFAWSQVIQTAAWAFGAIILVGCWFILRRQPVHHLANSAGVLTLLAVLAVVTATALPALWWMGGMTAAIVLLFGAFVVDRHLAWFWCGMGIGLYTAAFLLRQATAGLALADPPERLVLIYGFSVIALLGATYLGQHIAAHLHTLLLARQALQGELQARAQAWQHLQQTMQKDAAKRTQIEEEQERLIAQLAKVARLKDEFLASMSHELRTPLNSILGMTEALTDEIYGELTPRQRRALGTIDASGRHLLSLINDILDLAKIESGQVELNYGTVDVDALCQAALRLVQPTAEKKQITLTFVPDPAVKVMTADGRRLKQILLNLLSNGIKFTPEGGVVGLQVIGAQTQTGTANAGAGAGYAAGPETAVVQFVVTDTGVGIAPAAMEKLFKPFVQVDSSLSRHYDGTGLGLALVYRMVELHQGTVTVASEVDKGSRFTVMLPWTNSYSTANLVNDALSSPPAPLSPKGAYGMQKVTSATQRLPVAVAPLSALPALHVPSSPGDETGSSGQGKPAVTPTAPVPLSTDPW
ncbi:MAG: HAMP domain-containing sensor histidine kinase [Caldilineaceae bacterium]